MATQAPFDSSSKQDDPLCLEDTRTDVLKEIRAWIYGQEESCIFWLSGMAGTGKSTIARTISRELSERGALGASFFFVRGGGDVAHAGLFFTSIARQLVVTHPALKQYLSEAVRNQPDIASKSRKDQWTKLIVEPLAKAQLTPQRPLLVIVVDALDECDNDNDMKGIVALLAQAKDIASVRTRIVLTSRPETPMLRGFRKLPQILHRDLLLHDVPKDVVNGDICLFFYSQFEEVKQEQEWLAEDWPGVGVINQLVHMSDGLFIFAATVCRFVSNEERMAEDALSLFVSGGSSERSPLQGSVDEAESGNTAILDTMYRQIMAQSLRQDVGPTSGRAAKLVRDTIGAIAALSEPLPVSTLARLLCVREGDILFRLRRLHSVVRMPAAGDAPVRLFHESFREFLFDLRRCGSVDFHVDREVIHSQLLQCCISSMESTLQRNICRLEHSGILVDEIDRAIVDANIPMHVQYACRYWAYHFRQTNGSTTNVFEFLWKHLLNWFEAMSLMGRLVDCVQILIEIQDSISVSHKGSSTMSSTLTRCRMERKICGSLFKMPRDLFSSVSGALS